MFVCLSECGLVSVSVVAHRNGSFETPGVGIPDGCDPPEAGSGSFSQVICKSSTHS